MIHCFQHINGLCLTKLLNDSCRKRFSSGRVWTQGFAVARQEIYHARPISSPFCYDYFWNRLLFFAQASMHQHPPNAWDDRHITQCPAFSVEVGSCEMFFFYGLARNHDPSNLSIMCSWDDRHEPLHHPRLYFLPNFT